MSWRARIRHFLPVWVRFFLFSGSGHPENIKQHLLLLVSGFFSPCISTTLLGISRRLVRNSCCVRFYEFDKYSRTYLQRVFRGAKTIIKRIVNHKMVIKMTFKQFHNSMHVTLMCISVIVSPESFCGLIRIRFIVPLLRTHVPTSAQ